MLFNFFIIHPPLCRSEGDEARKILFYHSSNQNTSLVQQLKDIGLAEALNQISKNFSGSCEALRTHKFTHAFLEPEENFLISLVIKNGDSAINYALLSAGKIYRILTLNPEFLLSCCWLVRFIFENKRSFIKPLVWKKHRRVKKRYRRFFHGLPSQNAPAFLLFTGIVSVVSIFVEKIFRKFDKHLLQGGQTITPHKWPSITPNTPLFRRAIDLYNT